MTTDKLLFSLLKSHFGYEEFRPLQKEIVTNVLSGRDSLVLMPTGGGKSLALPYHAGLSNSIRSVHQERFARDQVTIIVDNPVKKIN